MRMRHLAFALVLLTSTAHASLRSLPHFRVPDCLGVNIHFVDPDPDEMDMMQQAGFGVVRMDLKWEVVEKEKGVYDFSGYRKLTNAMRKRNQIPLYILDYSNPLYEESRAVTTPEGRKAFARFAVEALVRLGQGPVIWEIWNEPNLELFWDVQPSAEDYVMLVETTSKLMRRIDPHCTIVAPAISQIKIDYLTQCFELGMLQWIDAVSVHPYRTSEPETVMEEYSALRKVIDKYSPDRFVPILSGEWGYSVHAYGDTYIDEMTQARYLARQFLSNFISGVRVSIWYDWRNDGDDPEEREHNFGTVDQNMEPKLAYWAAKTLTEQLRGMTYITRLKTSEKEDYLLLFSNSEREALAAWTTGRPHVIQLNLDASIDEATTLLGERMPLYRVGDKLEIKLTPEPVYLQAERINPSLD
ncbi:MAG: cellulase family glycosylhydrolase [Candidatus Hinthialibacter antarcticus]|nr:cellulase family glycosylhydrolase [Candidatus Hinthialibacter antarcticus]